MKLVYRILWLLILHGNIYNLQAQRVMIRPGTKLIYNVDDWGQKFRYIVTVKELTDSSQELQWQTSGHTIYKGRSVNPFIDIETANRLMVRPNLQSDEQLDENSVRFHPPYWMEVDIEAGADSLFYGLDVADAMLIKRKSGSIIKDIRFNGNKVNFEYRHYFDTNLGISIGFMPYGGRNWWLYYYKSENTALQLVDIITPPPPPPPVIPVIDTLNIADTIPQ